MSDDVAAADPAHGELSSSASEDGAGGNKAKSRHAIIWQEPDIPTFADFKAGGSARKRWFQYWFGPGKSDAFDLAFHWLLTFAPISMVSNLGGVLGRTFGMRTRPHVVARIRVRLRRLFPDMDADAIERIARSHFDNAGRIQAEFSVIRRVLRAGRLTVEGADLLKEATSSGPVILVCCHTGNWEMFEVALHAHGIRWGMNFWPPSKHSHRLIASRIRQGFGAILLPPGSPGTRPALRILQAGGIVSIFADEVHRNIVMAPFFDREPHLNGNLAIISRMRRMTGAKLLLTYSQRLPRCQYKVNFERLIEVPSIQNPEAPLIEDVNAINAAITPVVVANIHQWYFLDNAFE